MARRFDFQYYCSEGFHSIFTHGFMSFAAVCMIVACLLIMGSFSLVAVNLNHMLGDLEDDNLFLAYVDENYSRALRRALQSQIEAVPNVGQVAFVTRAEALDDFRAGREDNPLLADLPDEVLRDRFEIHVDDIEQLQGHLGAGGWDHRHCRCERGLRHRPGICHGAEHRCRRGHCAGDHAGRGVPVHHRQHHQAGLLLPPGGDRHYEDVRCHQRIYPVALHRGGHDFGMTGALVAFFAQWGIYELVSKAIIQNNGLSLITVLPLYFAGVAVFAGIYRAGLLIGVVGSVLAIRKFLQV